MSKSYKPPRNTAGKITGKTGISFKSDITFNIMQREPTRFFPLLQLVITILSTVSVICMTIDYLNFSLSKGYLRTDILPVIMVVCLCAAAFTVLNYAKSIFGKIIGAGYLIINAVFIMKNLKSAVMGFMKVAYTYALGAKLNEPFFAAQVKDALPTDLDMFFIAFGFIITLGISLSCIHKINFPLLFIFTFPFFELGAFWGWQASEWTVIVMISCWLVNLTLNLINHTTKKKNSHNTFAIYQRKKTFYLTSENVKQKFYGYAAAFTALLTAAVFLISSLIPYSLTEYRPERFTELRRDISNGFKDFTRQVSDNSIFSSNMFPGRGKNIGGTNGGKLGLYDEITFSGLTALRVKTDLFEKPMYLRGYVGNKYSRNRWDASELADELEPYKNKILDRGYDKLYDIYTKDEYFGSSIYIDKDITIKTVNANKDVIYAPYFANYSDCDIIAKQEYEGMASPKKSKKNDEYSLKFNSILSSDWQTAIFNAQTYSQNSEASPDVYDEEVYKDEYRNFPVELEPILKDICESAEVYNYPYDIVYQIDSLKEYLSSQGFIYTLKPGVTPADRDFIEYFLTEQKQGYCTYYASAAVMLMRYLGYPARYVEGYVIQPSQYNKETSQIRVTDRCAHAWCEVYIDGLGWLPVEFTPGYDDGNVNLTDEDKETNKPEDSSSSRPDVSSSSDTSSSKSSSSNMSSSSKPSSSKNNAVSSSQSHKSDNSINAGAVTGSGSGSGSAFNTSDEEHSAGITLIIITMIFITAVAAVALIKRRTELAKTALKMGSKDKKKSIIFCYKLYLKYLKLIEITADGNITDSQMSDSIAKQMNETLPKQVKAFTDLSEMAIYAYMSDAEFDDGDAEQARKAVEDIQTAVYGQLNAYAKFTAKWVYNLY